MFSKLKFKNIVFAVFVVFAMTAATPTPSQAAVEGCTQTHTVIAGEYLSKIASTYGVNWFDLAELNKLEDANLIYVGQVLCIKTGGTTVTPPAPLPTTGSVQVYASSAVEDASVTLKGKTLDTSSTYTVYMSNYKINPTTDILVGVAKTDTAGAFTQTFSIPKPLYDVALIRVMLINSRGDIAANWFINTTGTGNLGGIGSAAITIKVEDVKEDDWVKITVSNLPVNVSFDVYLGKTGTEGEGGILLGRVSSSSSGKVTVTFDIPAELQGRSKLDLLVENDATNQSSFISFENEN